VFRPQDYEQTFAQIDFEQKNKISHRGLAMQQLINFLYK
jgi:XTP/dITP diphosphohydrolase